MLDQLENKSIENFFAKNEILFHRISKYSDLIQAQPGLEPRDIHEPAVSILTHLFSHEKSKQDHKLDYAEKHLYKSAVNVSRKYLSITIKQIDPYISTYGYNVLRQYIPDFENTQRIIIDSNKILNQNLTHTIYSYDIANEYIDIAGDLAREWYKFQSINKYLKGHVKRGINEDKKRKSEKLKENALKYLVFGVLGSIIVAIILNYINK